MFALLHESLCHLGSVYVFYIIYSIATLVYTRQTRKHGYISFFFLLENQENSIISAEWE